MQEIYESNKDCVGTNMAQHGLINWDDNDKGCYESTLNLTGKAGAYIASKDRKNQTFGGQKYSPSADVSKEITLSLLPFIRGVVSQNNRLIATVHRDSEVLE